MPLPPSFLFREVTCDSSPGETAESWWEGFYRRNPQRKRLTLSQEGARDGRKWHKGGSTGGESWIKGLELGCFLGLSRYEIKETSVGHGGKQILLLRECFAKL